MFSYKLLASGFLMEQAQMQGKGRPSTPFWVVRHTLTTALLLQTATVMGRVTSSSQLPSFPNMQTLAPFLLLPRPPSLPQLTSEGAFVPGSGCRCDNTSSRMAEKVALSGVSGFQPLSSF